MQRWPLFLTEGEFDVLAVPERRQHNVFLSGPTTLSHVTLCDKSHRGIETNTHEHCGGSGLLTHAAFWSLLFPLSLGLNRPDLSVSTTHAVAVKWTAYQP